MSVVDDSFGHPMPEEEKATMILAGGIAGQGYQCGMLWGAALAAGAQAYRVHGSDAKGETGAIIASQKALASFRTKSRNEIDCGEITSLDLHSDNLALSVLKFFAKGGPIGCFSLAGRYAPLAASAIDQALSGEIPDVPPAPVSCTTLLAKKMGASDLHAVMAAGLAGGIGLSGGACGALGTAIWIQAMDRPEGEDAGLSFSAPWVNTIVKRFLESSDYRFECAEIVGKEFKSVDQHAQHVCGGGCAEIIDALAVR